MTTTFCPLRWAYPIVDFSRQEVRTCCRTNGEQITPELIDALGTDIFLNTQFQKDRRMEMLKGIRHASCSSCWTTEDAGMQSLRTDNRWFPDPWRKKGNPSRFFHSLNPESVLKNRDTGEEITPAAVDEKSSFLMSHQPHMLELNLSNNCDLKCSYCSPHFSSKWESETDLWSIGTSDIVPPPSEKKDPRFEELFWEWFNGTPVRSCSRVGIIGGEPFLNPRLPEFVEGLLQSYENLPLNERPHSGYLDEKGKFLQDHRPLIYFVTNLNIPPKMMDRLTTDLLPRLVKTFHVEVHASLEGTGKRIEYSRHGLNWETFQKNADRLCELKLPGFTFGLQAAINSISITSLTDFLKYAWSLHERHQCPILLKQNMVAKPQNHHPAILTPDFARYVDEALAFLATVKEKAPPVADEVANWNSYYHFLKTIRDSIADEQGKRMNWEAGTIQDVRKNFCRFFSMYDEKRGTDFLGTFPEYAEFYRLCKA